MHVFTWYVARASLYVRRYVGRDFFVLISTSDARFRTSGVTEHPRRFMYHVEDCHKCFYVCKTCYAPYYFAAQFSTCAPVSTTLTTMKTTWGFSFHPHQVYFVQRPLIQLSSLWSCRNDYCFRFKIGLFLAKIQYEMRSWWPCQSWLKTRNSLSLWLFSASVCTFRSKTCCTTLFALTHSQRSLFQIQNWIIFSEDTM